MNQTTNLIQWKNIPDKQKAEHDFENYAYEYQNEHSTDWQNLRDDDIFQDCVYRLVIEPEKWYFLELNRGGNEVIIGSNLLKDDYSGIHPTVRPCKPDEIPKPEKTLEDRIKDEYSDFDVVMCYQSGLFWSIELDDDLLHSSDRIQPHINAQSMKGFAGYIFDDADGFERDERPIGPDYIHPVAVLFTRGEG
jgi:hypothetical protein